MSDDELERFLQNLADRGIQVWHNRGRIYCGPLKLTTDEDRALIAYHKEPLIGHMRRNPPPEACDLLQAPCPPNAGSYEGRMSRKPWDYELSVIIPTLGPVDLVETAVSCWRNQTVSPYFILIETGPSKPEQDRFTVNLRGHDCEVHQLAAHGWRHSSAPVSAALDLAFATCQTRYALCTHADVFPRRGDVIENLLAFMGHSGPVLGYQMSKRQGSDEWLSCVSHTLTMVDMKVMRRERITWNLLAALECDDEVEQRYFGWPDTETQFGRSLRAAGIVPTFLGRESNAAFYENDFIVHWRSAPSIRHYYPERADQRHPGLVDWLQQTQALRLAAPLPRALPEA